MGKLETRRSSMSFAIGGLGHWEPEKDRQNNQTPPWGWSCFHCGMHFLPTMSGFLQAKRHFGTVKNAPTACTGAAVALVAALRARPSRTLDLPAEVVKQMVRIDEMERAKKRTLPESASSKIGGDHG